MGETGVLVFAEQDAGKLSEVGLELLSKGKELAQALNKELEQVRVTGYAVDDREYHPGVRCIAAPVFGISGVIASLGISAPADRMEGDRLRVIAPLVVDTAARISRELGGPTSRKPS